MCSAAASIRSAPGFWRRRSSIASELSIPATRTALGQQQRRPLCRSRTRARLLRPRAARAGRRRRDHRGIELARRLLVVSGGYSIAEVPLVTPAEFVIRSRRTKSTAVSSAVAWSGQAETVGGRAQLAHLGSDHDDLRRFSQGGEACDAQLVHAELASRSSEIARDESMHSPRARRFAHGVTTTTTGAAFEVGSAFRPAVRRRPPPRSPQAPVHVVPEAVVAVPGVAEADDSHENVNAPQGAPWPVARCTVQTRQASCERTTWNSSTGFSRSSISIPTKLCSMPAAALVVARGAVQAVGVMIW